MAVMIPWSHFLKLIMWKKVKHSIIETVKICVLLLQWFRRTNYEALLVSFHIATLWGVTLYHFPKFWIATPTCCHIYFVLHVAYFHIAPCNHAFCIQYLRNTPQQIFRWRFHRKNLQYKNYRLRYDNEIGDTKHEIEGEICRRNRKWYHKASFHNKWFAW